MVLSGRLAVALVFIIFSPALEAFPVSGKISVSSPFPEKKLVKVSEKYQKTCGDFTPSQRLLVSERGDLKNALVYLDGNFARGEASGQSEIIMDQRDCHYDPHVVLLHPSQALKIQNSDPLDHDVRAFEESKMLFRFEIPYEGKAVSQRFEKPGIYLLRCGLHPWMHAYVIQAAHEFYALTESTGRFSFSDVPKGNYHLKIWHEVFGDQEISLEVLGPIDDFHYVFKSGGNNA